MTPLCVKLKDVTPDQLSIFRCLCKTVEELKEEKGGSLTCHEVCRQLALTFPATVLHYKGKFAGMDHSWLLFKHDKTVLLDPYPWACASGPMLVTLKGMSPWRNLYQGVLVRE